MFEDDEDAEEGSSGEAFGSSTHKFVVRVVGRVHGPKELRIKGTF